MSQITDLTGYKWVPSTPPTSSSPIQIGGRQNIGTDIYSGENVLLDSFSKVEQVTISSFYTFNFSDFTVTSSPTYPRFTYSGSDWKYYTGAWTYTSDTNCYVIFTTNFDDGWTEAQKSVFISYLENYGTLIEPEPQEDPKISIGTSPLVSASVGNADVQSIWVGNVKVYEATETP